MKSCLRSPSTTPTHSVAGTPSGSGCASPGAANCPVPCLRKKVSFCREDDGLEVVFQADDWDRTPAPVAPKLSYQDLLELKQLLQSLPRAPYNSSSRVPFTTSMPRIPSPPASSAASSFPISRLAASPSLTPAKWKNRYESNVAVDPEILPYLDSVPIRLLPLLPTSSEESQNNTASLPSASPNPTDSSASQTQAPAAPSPPAITLQPLKSSSPEPSSPQNQTPTRRKPNFSFVPLLPVQEETKLPEESKVPLLVHSAPPVKHFNMPFLPLLPPEEHSPAPSVVSEPTPHNEAPAEEADDHGCSSYFPMNYSHQGRSPTSTPSLSSAGDTDTDSEAPSVNSPDPSSPIDDYDALTHYFEAHPPFVHHHDAGTRHAYASANLDSTHNSYFPPMPTEHSLPSGIGPDASLSNTPISAARLASYTDVAPGVKKTKLEALPSPALAPPSPFSLYPSEPEDGDVDAESGVGLDEAMLRVSPSGTISVRPFAARPSGLSMSSTASSSSSSSSSSAASSSSASVSGENESELADEVGELDEKNVRALEPSPVSSVSTSLSDTPELTIEFMRAAYDKKASAAAAQKEKVSNGRDVLGPSLRRAERR